MSTFSFNEFKLKLQDSLKRIGRKNGTSAPTSQDPGDKLLHELYCDQDAERFFKKQKEATLKKILEEFPVAADTVENVCKRATKLKQGEKTSLLQSEHYALNLEARTPSNRFKKEKLTVALRKRGWTDDQVQKLIEDCSEYDAPAKVFTVVSNL